MPKYKYIEKAKKDFPEGLKLQDQYEDFISDTIKKKRYPSALEDCRSVKGILENNFARPAYFIAYLKESEVEVDDLGEYLKSKFQANPNFIEDEESTRRSELRKIIRIYDFLKYKKSHE